MEQVESSHSRDDSLIWAKLVPVESAYPSLDIRSREAVICSATMGNSVEEHQWCEIKWRSDNDSGTIRNLSSNGIIVDGKLLGEEIADIRSGSEITAGPHREVYLTYKFEAIPSQVNDKGKIEIALDVEHAKCSICLNIWHDVVTVAPCLHNFCNGCFSEWLRRTSSKLNSVNQQILCPQCRSVVYSVGRNHFLHNIEEAILQTSSTLKRSDKEIALLNAYASIKSFLVVDKFKSRKRPLTVLDNEIELPCYQCGSELGGFQCSRTTIHLRCQVCGVRIPSRPDIGVPQKCLGCDRILCGAYWASLGVDAREFNEICHQETFKPVLEHTISRIPDMVHQNNPYEREITERCIQRTGKTLQAIISEWITKFDNKEIDRLNLQLNHSDMITSRTYFCTDCYFKLIDFLLYWFRVTLPSHYLPPDASDRENCWYGSLCRTQQHNEEHARKRNHVCRPTRGNR